MINLEKYSIVKLGSERSSTRQQLLFEVDSFQFVLKNQFAAGSHSIALVTSNTEERN